MDNAVRLRFMATDRPTSFVAHTRTLLFVLDSSEEVGNLLPTYSVLSYDKPLRFHLSSKIT